MKVIYFKGMLSGQLVVESHWDDITSGISVLTAGLEFTRVFWKILAVKKQELEVLWVFCFALIYHHYEV